MLELTKVFEGHIGDIFDIFINSDYIVPPIISIEPDDPREEIGVGSIFYMKIMYNVQDYVAKKNLNAHELECQFRVIDKPNYFNLTFRRKHSSKSLNSSGRVSVLVVHFKKVKDNLVEANIVYTGYNKSERRQAKIQLELRMNMVDSILKKKKSQADDSRK